MHHHSYLYHKLIWSFKLTCMYRQRWSNWHACTDKDDQTDMHVQTKMIKLTCMYRQRLSNWHACTDKDDQTDMHVQTKMIKLTCMYRQRWSNWHSCTGKDDQTDMHVQTKMIKLTISITSRVYLCISIQSTDFVVNNYLRIIAWLILVNSEHYK